MIPLHDVNVFGIYVTPAAACLPVALVLSFVLRTLLDRTPINRFVWNRALFDLSCLVGITSLLILSLRFGA